MRTTLCYAAVGAILLGSGSMAIATNGVAPRAGCKPADEQYGRCGAPATTITIVDTLGVATPATTFSIFGAGGISIGHGWRVGPRFVLTAPTVVTEIGGFLSHWGNCNNSCPSQLPFTVEIRRAVNGLPDPLNVIATFTYPRDDHPTVISYESVAPKILLGAGTYFALFATPGATDNTGLLGNVLLPSGAHYFAGVTALAFFDPDPSRPGDRWWIETDPGAVRILGIVAPTSKNQCKGGGWQTFQIFKNQGDCVSHVAAGGKKGPRGLK